MIRPTQPIWLWVQAYLDDGSYQDHQDDYDDVESIGGVALDDGSYRDFQDDYDDGESIEGVALDDTLPPTRGKFAPSPIFL